MTVDQIEAVVAAAGKLAGVFLPVVGIVHPRVLAWYVGVAHVVYDLRPLSVEPAVDLS